MSVTTWEPPDREPFVRIPYTGESCDDSFSVVFRPQKYREFVLRQDLQRLLDE